MSENNPALRAHIHKRIIEHTAYLKDLLISYPAGYPVCCGTETTLEGLWSWSLNCQSFTVELAEEFYGEGFTDADAQLCDELFCELYTALSPDLNLPLGALEI